MKTTGKTLNEKYKNILLYLRTIILSFLFVLIVVVISLFFSFQDVEQKVKFKKLETEKIEYYMVGLMIEQNKYLIKRHPCDYKLYKQLGYLYMLHKKYKDSEDAYKKSIEYAPHGAYSPYKGLAMTYILSGEYKKAEKIMDDIDDNTTKELKSIKGEVFKKIAEKYYQDGYYYLAAKKYEDSLFYYSKINPPPKDLINNIKISTAACYQNLADLSLEENNYDVTVKMLELASQYSPTSKTIKYKKALALIESDPETSAKLFLELFKEDPQHTNFYVYYELLRNLVIQNYKEGDISKAKLYKYRAEKATDFVQNNIIYQNELVFETYKTEAVYSDKKLKLLFDFKIRNLSRLNLDKLHIKVVFKKDNNIIAQYEQELFDGLKELAMHEETPVVSIKSERNLKIKNKENPKFVADVILYKNPKYQLPTQTYNLSFRREMK